MRELGISPDLARAARDVGIDLSRSSATPTRDVRKDPRYIDNIAATVSLSIFDRAYVVHWGQGEDRKAVLVPETQLHRQEASAAQEIQRIYSDRNSALLGLTGPILQSAGHGFDLFYTYYVDDNGVIYPTRFSPDTTPRIYEGILRKDEDMRQGAHEAEREMYGLAAGMLIGKTLSGTYGLARNPRLYGGIGSGRGSRAPVGEGSAKGTEGAGARPTAQPVEVTASSEVQLQAAAPPASPRPFDPLGGNIRVGSASSGGNSGAAGTRGGGPAGGGGGRMELQSIRSVDPTGRVTTGAKPEFVPGAESMTQPTTKSAASAPPKAPTGAGAEAQSSYQAPFFGQGAPAATPAPARAGTQAQPIAQATQINPATDYSFPSAPSALGRVLFPPPESDVPVRKDPVTEEQAKIEAPPYQRSSNTPSGDPVPANSEDLQLAGKSPAPKGGPPSGEAARAPGATPPERVQGLESRIEALEGSEAPAADLIEQLDSIDPHAPDAAQRIAALEERVAQWEKETPGPADPGLGEVTVAEVAARRATLGEAAERLEANKMQGSAGELRVEGEILSGNPIPELGSPATLRGSQVQVETSAGLRIIDHLVELPTGEVVALEVKTGGAVRSQYQLDCDLALALQGGRIVGGGPMAPIRTVVLRR